MKSVLPHLNRLLNKMLDDIRTLISKPEPLPATWDSSAVPKVRRLPDHIQTLQGITFKSVPGGLEGDGWTATRNTGADLHYWTVRIEGERLPNSPSIQTIDDVIRAVAKSKT